MRTFFAHQSVGADILAGIEQLARGGSPVAHVRNLAQARDNIDPDLTHSLLIFHQRIGANREPLTKIAGFRAVLDAKHRPEIDVALLKFCYVDIASQAEAETLWRHYETAIEELSTVHPGVHLVHCTVPLRALPEGPYAWLRRALDHRLGRRQHPAIAANRARDWFNRQLRQRFGDGRGLFDLAALESRRANGKPCELIDAGERVPSLAREWTYDGGHLNDRGRTMAAAAFLEFLQKLQDSSKR